MNRPAVALAIAFAVLLAVLAAMRVDFFGDDALTPLELSCS